jgi:hypothetical protein
VTLPTIHGRKEDLWVFITVKEVQVHFILEEFRDILELENKLVEQIPEEEMEDYLKWNKIPKKKPDYPIHNTGPSAKPKKTRQERREENRVKREEDWAKDENYIPHKSQEDNIFELLLNKNATEEGHEDLEFLTLPED